MPSDERTAPALRALARPIAAYRAAVVTVTERARGYLAAGGGVERARAGLGRFAAGRIDVERFADLFARDGGLDPLSERALRRAVDALNDVINAGDDLFLANVPPGGKMARVAAARLARLGRAFGAARVIEHARIGAYQPAVHDAWLDEFPFEDWNRTERLLAPPLVITVDGADVRAGGLAEFADGAMKVVLLVRGASAPAPLVRLITPGTFVMQTTDTKDLERVAAFAGPAVAAVVPNEAARFVHDPAGGEAPWQRLTIVVSPERPPAHALGALSVWELEQELKQLLSYAHRPVGAGGPLNGSGNGASVAPPDPAERLAAWLLDQAGLETQG